MLDLGFRIWLSLPHWCPTSSHREEQSTGWASSERLERNHVLWNSSCSQAPKLYPQSLSVDWIESEDLRSPGKANC